MIQELLVDEPSILAGEVESNNSGCVDGCFVVWAKLCPSDRSKEMMGESEFTLRLDWIDLVVEHLLVGMKPERQEQT